jgi:hypothetical protein
MIDADVLISVLKKYGGVARSACMPAVIEVEHLIAAIDEMANKSCNSDKPPSDLDILETYARSKASRMYYMSDADAAAFFHEAIKDI